MGQVKAVFFLAVLMKAQGSRSSVEKFNLKKVAYAKVDSNILYLSRT